MSWQTGFYVLFGAAMGMQLLNGIGTTKLKRMISKELAARRRHSLQHLEMLDTLRPFLEDLVRIDPTRSESIEVGLLELDSARENLRKHAEDDTFAKRFFGDKP